jgi:hypothetical protein
MITNKSINTSVLSANAGSSTNAYIYYQYFLPESLSPELNPFFCMNINMSLTRSFSTG